MPIIDTTTPLDTISAARIPDEIRRVKQALAGAYSGQAKFEPGTKDFDAVFFAADGTWKRSRSGDAERNSFHGLADVTHGNVLLNDQVDNPSWKLTPNASVYVSAEVAGALTSSPSDLLVGHALTDTVLITQTSLIQAGTAVRDEVLAARGTYPTLEDRLNADDLSDTNLLNEVTTARGSTTSLDARISGAIDQDGNLRATVTASAFTPESEPVVRADVYKLYVTTNAALPRYVPGVRVRMNGAVFAFVEEAVFSSANNRMEVTVSEAVPQPLTTLDYSFAPNELPLVSRDGIGDIPHSSLQDIAGADSTSADATQNKHVSNAQMRQLVLHTQDTNNPHGTTLGQLGGLSATTINAQDNKLGLAGITSVNALKFARVNGGGTQMEFVEKPYPIEWTYPDALARQAASGLSASDIGRLARQLDDQSLWILVGNNPTSWSPVSKDVPFMQHIPQSIVEAKYGALPSGWSAEDCGIQPEVLTVSGSNVVVQAGLRVACADSGSVILSEILGSPQNVDLSGASDGIYYVYADVAEDGTFSTFGATAIAPEVGIKRGGTDIIPAFSSATLPGWGTVGASSEPQGLYPSWKAFNRTAEGSQDGWLAATNTNEWIQFSPAWSGSKRLVGLVLSPLNALGGDGQFPKDITAAVGGVQVFSGTLSKPAVTDSVPIMLDSPVDMGGAFRLNVLTNHGSANIVIGEIRLLFAGDIYNPATRTHLNSSDAPIRRVYLGTAEKASGAITEVYSYYFGDSAVLPVNGGSFCSISTKYSDSLPFVYSRHMTAEAEVQFLGSFGKVGFVLDTNGVGVMSSVFSEGLITQTGGLALAGTPAKTGTGLDITTNVTSARVRAVVKRGY